MTIYPSFLHIDASGISPVILDLMLGLSKVRHFVSRLMLTFDVAFGRIKTEKTCFPVHNRIGYMNEEEDLILKKTP